MEAKAADPVEKALSELPSDVANWSLRRNGKVSFLSARGVYADAFDTKVRSNVMHFCARLQAQNAAR
jgi:hypothetical protein